jgi:hypothetical protein
MGRLWGFTKKKVWIKNKFPSNTLKKSPDKMMRDSNEES